LLARSPIIAGGALGGVTLVCALALVLGPPGSVLGALDAVQARLIAVRPRASAPRAANLAPAAFTLFGQGAAPTLRLDGVALSPGRKAALISINGAPSDWIEVGDAEGGVTLVEVTSDEAVVDSVAGTKTLQLGEGPAAPATAAPPASHPAAGASAMLLPGQAPMPANLPGFQIGPSSRSARSAGQGPTSAAGLPPGFAIRPPMTSNTPPPGPGPG